MSGGQGTSGEGGLLDLTVRELLAAVADRTPAPGGGGAAALATALAAALTAMASRFGDDAVSGDADALRARVEPLADADAAAYGAFLTALRLPREDPDRRDAVAAARDGAVAVPAEIGTIARSVAELAAGLVRDGNPNLRGDAMAAVLLAAAATATTVELVAANVGAEHPEARAARDRAGATAALAAELAGDQAAS